MREETSRHIEGLQLLCLRPLNSSKVVNYTRGSPASLLEATWRIVSLYLLVQSCTSSNCCDKSGMSPTVF